MFFYVILISVRVNYMKKIFNILLLILWMIVIFVMSSFDATKSSDQSGFLVNVISNILDYSDLETLSFIIRKCAHFTEYLILGILMYNVVKYYNKRIYIILILCVLYAISDEVHQIFVIGRACKIFDVFIDSVGSLTGILINKYIIEGYVFSNKIN